MASQPTPKQSSKEAKVLACIVAALQSSKTKLDIDYDEFMTLDGAPTKHAAQMRLYRLGKSLGVELCGSGKATKGPATPKTAVKRKLATQKSKIDDQEEDEEDEPEQSPSKTIGSKETSSKVGKLEDDSADENGKEDDGERA